MSEQTMDDLKQYYHDSIRAIKQTDTDRHNITDIQDYVRALESENLNLKRQVNVLGSEMGRVLEDSAEDRT